MTWKMTPARAYLDADMVVSNPVACEARGVNSPNLWAARKGVIDLMWKFPVILSRSVDILHDDMSYVVIGG